MWDYDHVVNDGDDVECEECGEPGDDWGDIDPVAHFWDDAANCYVMAHGQCGEDAGLRLA